MIMVEERDTPAKQWTRTLPFFNPSSMCSKACSKNLDKGQLTFQYFMLDCHRVDTYDA